MLLITEKLVIILLSFLFQSYIQKSTGTEVKIKDGRTRYDHHFYGLFPCL